MNARLTSHATKPSQTYKQKPKQFSTICHKGLSRLCCQTARRQAFASISRAIRQPKEFGLCCTPQDEQVVFPLCFTRLHRATLLRLLERRWLIGDRSCPMSVRGCISQSLVPRTFLGSSGARERCSLPTLF